MAILALKAMGYDHVDFLVPNRFHYGYGLTPEIVELARSKDPDLNYHSRQWYFQY